ncbi:spermidine synthase [Crucibulum laeve]|uniref:Spermidine synthase n=1 Tax=Crucibulum laeve TaxID=68775 RepID=A0A5C3MEL4_9AGAR|nr:spermidine synthase [Crucibulum laeve]
MSKRPSEVQNVALTIAHGVLATLSLSLVLFAYERALIPLYGSGPTSFLLNKITLASIALSAVHPFKISLNRNRFYAGLALSLAPNATYWIAVWSSRRLKDPVYGPALTHLAVVWPLTFILSTFVVENSPAGSRDSIIPRIVRAGVASILAVRLAQRVWPSVGFLNHISGSEIYLALAGLAYSSWIALFPTKAALPTVSKKQKSKSISRSATSAQIYVKSGLLVGFIAVWWSTYDKLKNPVLPHPLMETFTHPSEPLQVHSAVESVTGLITVGESLVPPGYTGTGNDMYSARYIRASHSILGGVWMGEKVHVLNDELPLKDSFGNSLGDSIYATFVLQEAVRLINSTAKGKRGKWENALIIGLGAGISATSFIRHGINTTIVEIDPAVYEAARTYFGLPDPGPGNVFLEDARSWVSEKRASTDAGHKEKLFDIVVHDCFSGGGVPEHIFTIEFWETLKVLMEPEGVLAVNFAGIIRSESSRMIIHTLERSFGNCRAFHDMFGELSDEIYDTDFINMVLFCTRSPEPIAFRNARYSDYLGSPLRRHVLTTLPKREVNLDAIRTSDESKYVLTDAHNPLGKLQEEQGNHHWSVMREVLPDVHWETY